MRLKRKVWTHALAPLAIVSKLVHMQAMQAVRNTAQIALNHCQLASLRKCHCSGYSIP
jgi:hypothetical protein